MKEYAQVLPLTEIAEDRVVLDVEKFQAARRLSWPFATPAEVAILRRNDIVSMEVEDTIYCVAQLATQKLPEIRYPASWTEAVKERFAPQWVLRRWPVRYVIWDVKAVYPRIAIPKEKPVIYVQRSWRSA